jgi:AP2-like factor, euAP2 lineage
VDNVGNRANSKVDKDNQSGFKGVTYYPLNKKWGAIVVHKGQRYWQGLYDTAEGAALAYNAAALKIIGECAWLNKVDSGAESVRKHTTAKSGFRGVSYYAVNKKWSAKLTHNGEKYWLGLHDTRLEAAWAYNREAKRIVGETAWLNPICRPFALN